MKSQVLVGVGAQDCAEGLPVAVLGPADDAAFEFAEVVPVDLGDCLVVVVDPVVDPFGQFLAGHRFAGRFGGRGARRWSFGTVAARSTA
ncbi:hypothetical protein [Frankia sp. Cj3]|uniref:hypothetical protein n=1 Tax=Frankia sp. Cj3 TaxID=2880976 RepID=UPI001EF5431B|nr:hypothetical protein [Frankia sp. Cj3]